MQQSSRRLLVATVIALAPLAAKGETPPAPEPNDSLSFTAPGTKVWCARIGRFGTVEQYYPIKGEVTVRDDDGTEHFFSPGDLRRPGSEGTPRALIATVVVDGMATYVTIPDPRTLVEAPKDIHLRIGDAVQLSVREDGTLEFVGYAPEPLIGERAEAVVVLDDDTSYVKTGPNCDIWRTVFNGRFKNRLSGRPTVVLDASGYVIVRNLSEELGPEHADALRYR